MPTPGWQRNWNFRHSFHLVKSFIKTFQKESRWENNIGDIETVIFTIIIWFLLFRISVQYLQINSLFIILSPRIQKVWNHRKFEYLEIRFSLTSSENCKKKQTQLKKTTRFVRKDCDQWLAKLRKSSTANFHWMKQNQTPGFKIMLENISMYWYFLSYKYLFVIYSWEKWI